MGKYTLLILKIINLSAILISGQRVLANEEIKVVEQKGEGKDWIEKLKDEISREFRPEFINRIDDIVVFKPLIKESMIKITNIVALLLLAVIAG